MKTYENYATVATQKAIKASNRLICTTADDGFIYLSSGFWMLRMTPAEYAAVAQAATKRDPGNWELADNTQRDFDGSQFVQMFRDAVAAAGNSAEMTRSNLLLELNNGGTAAFHRTAAGRISAYNTAYLAPLAPGYELRSPGAICPAVAYRHGEPFAMVMPIRVSDGCSDAFAMYEAACYDDSTPAATNDETAQLQATNAQLTAELEALRTRLAQLEAQTQQTSETQRPTADTRTTADQVAARFADLDGVTATIKGAQTASPVIWLGGNTDPHADAIKAAGGRWSNKRGAFYVRVA